MVTSGCGSEEAPLGAMSPGEEDHVMRRLISARALIVLLVGTGWATAASADTITVCWDGSGDHLTIQEGIDAALGGDEVVVCDGTYTGVGNKDLDFGGRLITVRSESGADTCIIDCENDGRGFYFHNGEATDAVLEGLTIWNGRVDRNSPGGAIGGAILCESGSPTIRNCAFSWNTAIGGSVQLTGLGGGVYYGPGTVAIVENCSFTENSVIGGTVMFTGFGGGIECYQSAVVTISNCTFVGNTATCGSVWTTGLGAAIGVVSDNATVRDCTFLDNTGIGNGTIDTGGGAVATTGNTRIERCDFIGNRGTGTPGGGGLGGGIITGGGAVLAVADCTFINNYVDTEGGALFVGSQSTATIDHCIFLGNESAFVAGALNLTRTDAIVRNCLFGGNRAARGGAIMNAISSESGIERVAEFVNCTIVDNQADMGGGLWTTPCDQTGGACDSSTSILSNCIVWGNTPNQIEEDSGAVTTTVTYSDVQGGYAGEGNIDADPLFVDPINDDYHLSPGSPCIDAADNTAVPADEADLDGDGDTAERIPVDLDWRLRFADRPGTIDTGVADPPDYPYVVDMGAYEYQCDGDLDGDIDLSDLAQLLANYGTTSGACYEDGDIDLDGDVDLSDLAALLAVYGTTCP